MCIPQGFGATFRKAGLGFVVASRRHVEGGALGQMNRVGYESVSVRERVEVFTTESTGRSQAKTRQLVLRETPCAHNEYKKHFQLIHISISLQDGER